MKWNVRRSEGIIILLAICGGRRSFMGKLTKACVPRVTMASLRACLLPPPTGIQHTCVLTPHPLGVPAARAAGAWRVVEAAGNGAGRRLQLQRA